MIKKYIFLLLLAGALISCSFNDPADKNYFNTIRKIKGGLPPEAPSPITLTSCGGGATIQFTQSADPEGEALYYLIYTSHNNPSDFNEKDYYHPIYYLMHVTDVAPFTLIAGESYYLWMTAYDGGRESDHSNVLLIPEGCP